MSHTPHAETDPFNRRGAVAIAIFTVVLAFSNMLTNQARTQAILSSNRATNQWAFFQSKSTKQNLARVQYSLIERLDKGDTAALERLDKEIARYDVEKEVIRVDAEELAARLRAYEHEEHLFEYAATVSELAIVLAGVALLLTSRRTLYASVGVAALAVSIVTFAAVKSPPDEDGPEAPAVEGSPDAGPRAPAK